MGLQSPRGYSLIIPERARPETLRPCRCRLQSPTLAHTVLCTEASCHFVYQSTAAIAPSAYNFGDVGETREVAQENSATSKSSESLPSTWSRKAWASIFSHDAKTGYRGRTSPTLAVFTGRAGGLKSPPEFESKTLVEAIGCRAPRGRNPGYLGMSRCRGAAWTFQLFSSTCCDPLRSYKTRTTIHHGTRTTRSRCL